MARSNHELEQFAYVASHDLQEPLRTVNGFLKLLADRCRDQLDARAVQYIDMAVDAGTRMSHLIRDLLEYSRVGRSGGDFEPTDAGLAFDGALANLQTAIEEAGATVSRDPMLGSWETPHS